MDPVLVVDAVRTPIGRFGASLAALPAVALGEAAVRGLLQRIPGLEEGGEGAVDLLCFGHARQAGCGPNPARQVVRRAGLGDATPALTVNQACASGLQALQLAADALRLGRARVAVAGGMESMSRVPFLLDRMREGYRLGDAAVVDAMYRDGFLCPLADMVMGETAELLARERGISREEQDRFALESQQKAARALEEGRFREEIVPVTVPARKGGATEVAADEHPRPSTTLEKLGRLPPVFDPGEGTVTAGNSSGITDGAAALLLTTASEAERRGWEPLAVFEAAALAGCDPRRMGLGPVPATRRLLEGTGLGLEDFDLVELNEAFAAQVLAVLQDLPLERSRLNVLGGAIALGHPIGCTGARIVVTLLHEMRRRQLRRGLATLCVSGGLGMSAAFRRP